MKNKKVTPQEAWAVVKADLIETIKQNADEKKVLNSLGLNRDVIFKDLKHPIIMKMAEADSVSEQISALLDYSDTLADFVVYWRCIVLANHDRDSKTIKELLTPIKKIK